MKFNVFNWNLFKESEVGKKLIDDFAKITDSDEFTDLVLRLFPDSGINAEAFANVLNDTYTYKIAEYEHKIASGEELFYNEVWLELIFSGYVVEDKIIIKRGDFREMIDLIPFLSINLYMSFPDVFVPYLFFSGFVGLKRILDFYEIEIPILPSKKNYKERCNYYLLLNDILLTFRDELGLSPAEFCAFLYGFAPAQIEVQDVESTNNRIWISGGVVNSYDSDKIYYWGNNPMSRQGDWMLLYELSPVSAITSMWRLVSDGCYDPFFQWSAQAAVKHIMDFPSISLNELRNDSYFSMHPLIRRNMQGVNGTPFNAVDYHNLLRILSEKGFDISTLPKLESVELIENTFDIKLEKDVEEKLLIPLLDNLKLEDGKDYIRQLPIHAGRGHRIFPDFAVYYSDQPDEETASILMEAKYYIRNEGELIDAFLQAKSYANLLGSEVIILCDMRGLYIFKKINSKWNKNTYSQYNWDSLADADKYAEIAKIFDKKQYN